MGGGIAIPLAAKYQFCAGVSQDLIWLEKVLDIALSPRALDSGDGQLAAWDPKEEEKAASMV